MRPARVDDKDGVLAFCQNTFSWGDYITDAWDRWLTDNDGQMLVGVVDQQPVALIHIAFIDDGVAWLEGMRVHPNFRRQGIGGTIDQAARAFARLRGSRLARLATSIRNIPAQKTLAKESYSCVARFNEWEAEPARIDFSTPRRAVQNDADRILELWHIASRRTKRALMQDQHWRWAELSRGRLLDYIHSGEVRIVDGGVALLMTFDEHDWSGTNLYALVGDEESMFTLAYAARGETAYRGYQHIEAMLIDHPPVNTALERAGYHRDSGMLIYEQPL